MSRWWIPAGLLAALAFVLGGCPAAPADDDDAGDDDTTAEPQPYGPENTWWHALADDLPGDLAGTGWSTGDVANNFTLVDQFGDDVELYQFYGQVIVLDLFTYW
jgi:hypothetical protein